MGLSIKPGRMALTLEGENEVGIIEKKKKKFCKMELKGLNWNSLKLIHFRFFSSALVSVSTHLIECLPSSLARLLV